MGRERGSKGRKFLKKPLSKMKIRKGQEGKRGRLDPLSIGDLRKG